MEQNEFNPSDHETLPSMYHQVREELVRQISEASRWSAVEEAFVALLKVRHMAKQHQQEMRHLRGDILKGLGAITLDPGKE